MKTDSEQVGEFLKASRELLVTAESCTGGLLAEQLTQIPGASAWYAGGWVMYSNEMKTAQLGVDATLIETQGAVSWQVAKAMCEGALKQSGASVAISTTGIAGPSGGSDEKPVGTIFLGCSVSSETQVRCFRFSGDRNEVRKQATRAAIKMMLYLLAGDPIAVMSCQYGDTIA
jgi:nicotinamide-nucleotide amidase